MDYRRVSQICRSCTHAWPSATSIRQAREENFGMLRLPLLLIALLVMSACASISEEECLAADWYSLGVEDGSKGYPMSRIGRYRKDCAEVGVAPDAQQYGEGRMVGLETFCTYERGYAEGKRGAGNKAVCPAGPLEAEFMQGYEAGHYVYQVNRDVRNLERELAELRLEVDEVRADLDNGYRVDEAGNKHALGKYDRDAMYERLLALGREEGRLEGEIGALRSSIAGS